MTDDARAAAEGVGTVTRAKVAGRKAGEAWASDPAHLGVLLQQLMNGTPAVTRAEIWACVVRDGLATSPAVATYQAAFIAAVVKLVQTAAEMVREAESPDGPTIDAGASSLRRRRSGSLARARAQVK
jgi:hypothetical protein